MFEGCCPGGNDGGVPDVEVAMVAGLGLGAEAAVDVLVCATEVGAGGRGGKGPVGT
jgi:hypothetical protein